MHISKNENHQYNVRMHYNNDNRWIMCFSFPNFCLSLDPTEKVSLQVLSPSPIREGDNITLKCQADGNPPPTSFNFNIKVRDRRQCPRQQWACSATLQRNPSPGSCCLSCPSLQFNHDISFWFFGLRRVRGSQWRTRMSTLLPELPETTVAFTNAPCLIKMRWSPLRLLQWAVSGRMVVLLSLSLS